MVLVLLAFASYFALMTPFVQTRLVDYFTRILEERTGTTITIGRVEFRPIESLILGDVFVKDCRQDTLMFCERLVMRVDSVSFVKRKFTITEATFENATFNLWIERKQDGSESLTNVEQLINSLSASVTDTVPDTPLSWKVNLTRVSLFNSRFRYIESDYEPEDYGINWTDVDCRDLNVMISGIRFSKEGRYEATVTGLNFREKSGFEVMNMGGKVVATNNRLLVTNTLIQTGRSEVHLDTLEYNWVPDRDYWRNFTTKMQQRYVFTGSRVHFDDIAYFNGKLLGMNNTVYGSGVVFNTVSNLQGKDLEVYLGEKSVLHGSFTSKGLPRFFETDFNIDFTDTRVSPPEVEAIFMPWLENHYVKIPRMLHKYDYFTFDGNFKGKIEDFVLNTRSVTPGMEGGVVFNYAVDSTGDYHYGGRLTLSRVNFGFLTGQSFLKNGSFRGNFNGVLGDSISRFGMSSVLGYLDVYGGRLRGVRVSVGMEDEHLYMLSSVKNDSVRADFELNYLEGDSLQVADVRGYVNVRQWDTWGPSLCGERESFEFDFSGNLKTREDNNWFEAIVPSLKYENTRGTFATDSVRLTNTVLGRYSYSRVQSEMGEVSMEGFFRSLELTDLWNSFLVTYLPAYRYAVDKPLPEETSLIAEVRLNDVNPLLKVAYPSLKLSSGVVLSCKYSYADRRANLMLEADMLSFGDLKVRNSRLGLTGNGRDLKCSYAADEVKYMDFGRLYNVRNTMSANVNYVNNRLTWCNWGKETYCGSLVADLRLLKYGERHLAQVFIQPSTIVMADSVWHVGRSMILKEGNDVFVNNFEISRGKQSFSLRGRVSENEKDSLSMVFHDFNLAEFNSVLFDNGVKLFGLVNGKASVQDVYNNRLLYANVEVENWGINRDTLGTLNMVSRWDAPTSALQVSVINQMKNDQAPFSVFGHYQPSTDSLDMNLVLAGIDVNYLTRYFPDLLKSGEGALSGELEMKGTSRNTSINGFLAMDSVALILNALNTTFMIHDSLPVKGNRVMLDSFRIYDAKGHASVCSGFYDFRENRYDVNLKFNNFRILDTKQSQNEMFYGQLYITGQTRMHNTLGNSALSINLKPEPHSVLYIPLTSALTEGDGSFLRFINNRQPGEPPVALEDKSSLVSNFDLNANIEVNDNLEVQIIFDPTIGDILKTVGSGNLRFTLGKDNELDMFGEYKVEKGDYLFTLSNLINKKFVLTPGGTIKWNGSPYDATIDANAIYNLRTSLNDLLAGTSTTMDKNTKVPVECVLKLGDNLMNPNVQFGINFPSLDVQMRSLMQSLFSSQDEVNKQMFSLLLLNKFYTPDYLEKDAEQEERNTGYQMGVTTASELLSNQVSRWLSQISNNFDIGFSYRPGDQVTTNEFELALSTQIWNNRVTISANGNVAEGAKTNSNTSITGDFDVDVKLNRQGTLKLKAYSHTNEKITYNATETVQGIGVSYQETFDTFRELFRKYMAIFRRKKQTDSPAQVSDNK